MMVVRFLLALLVAGVLLSLLVGLFLVVSYILLGEVR